MAQSPENVEERLERLETSAREVKGALTQVVVLLTEQSERVDAGFRQLWAELGTTRKELQTTREELTQRMDGVNQRLDRLITVTMKERTAGAERLSKIEERLDKLEERGGG